MREVREHAAQHAVRTASQHTSTPSTELRAPPRQQHQPPQI